MAAFVPTAFMGFAQQLADMELARAHRRHKASITLIARRSCRRAGTRQWRRGADLSASGENNINRSIAIIEPNIISTITSSYL